MKTENFGESCCSRVTAQPLEDLYDRIDLWLIARCIYSETADEKKQQYFSERKSRVSSSYKNYLDSPLKPFSSAGKDVAGNMTSIHHLPTSPTENFLLDDISSSSLILRRFSKMGSLQLQHSVSTGAEDIKPLDLVINSRINRKCSIDPDQYKK